MKKKIFRHRNVFDNSVHDRGVFYRVYPLGDILGDT
jgi:hypothetical protein